MKRNLLLSAAVFSWISSDKAYGHFTLAEESSSSIMDTSQTEHGLNFKKSVHFNGVRLFATDEQNLSVAGKYIHLENSIFELNKDLTLLVSKHDEQGNGIMMDDHVSLLAENIHFISQMEGKNLLLNGAIRTTKDLTIESQGDIQLPTVLSIGDINISTNGSVYIPKDLLVNGKITIKAKYIKTEGMISLKDDASFLAEKIDILSSIFTAEKKFNLMAGESVNVSGNVGIADFSVTTPKLDITPNTKLRVKHDMIIYSNDVNLKGETFAGGLFVNAYKLTMQGNHTIGSFMINDLKELMIEPLAKVNILKIEDHYSPSFKRSNHGHLTVANHLGIFNTLYNAGTLKINGLLTAPASNIELLNDKNGFLDIYKLSFDQNKGISSFINKGKLLLQHESHISADTLVLGGQIKALNNLSLYSLNNNHISEKYGIYQPSESVLEVDKDFKIVGTKADISGQVSVDGNVNFKLSNSLNLSNASNGRIFIGKDLTIHVDEGVVSQVAPISLKGNLKLSCKIGYSLSGIEIENFKGKPTDFNSASNINVNHWLQNDNLLSKGGIHLRAENSATINGTVQGTKLNMTTENLRGNPNIHNEEETNITAASLDGNVLVYSNKANINFGKTHANSTYTGKGAEHNITFKEDSSLNINFEGKDLCVIDKGVYTGNLNGKADTVSLDHKGKGRLEGSIKTNKIIISTLNYPIEDVNKLNSSHIKLDIPTSNQNILKNLNIPDNRLLELTVNNLTNGAEIHGNIVMNIREDLENKGLIKGNNVILTIGGTFFKRKKSTVHGTENEVIIADYWDEEREFIDVNRVDTIKSGLFWNRKVSHHVTSITTDAFKEEIYTNRQDVKHIAKEGNLPLQNKHYKVSGDLTIGSNKGDVNADAQRFYDHQGSTTNIGFFSTQRKQNDPKPILNNTTLTADKNINVYAGGNLNANALQVNAGESLSLKATKEINMQTAAESYAYRRGQESGFLGFNSKSWVDSNVSWIQPSLTGKNITINTHRFDNSGLKLQSDTTEINTTEDCHLGAAKIEIPFERSQSSWWGLSGKSIKGKQVIPLVFSAEAKSKLKFITKNKHLSGDAPIISAERFEVEANTLNFTQANAEIIVDEELQYGPQFRLFGVEFSLAPDRYKLNEVLDVPRHISDNPVAKLPNSNLHKPLMNQAGIHTDAIDHSLWNVFSSGAGVRGLTANAHIKQGFGTKIDVNNLDISQVNQSRIAVDAIHSSTTKLGKDITFTGTRAQSEHSELGGRYTLGISPFFAEHSFNGKIHESSNIQHQQGNVSLGNVSLNQSTNLISEGANVRINQSSGQSLHTYESNVLDQSNTMKSNISVDIGFSTAPNPIIAAAPLLFSPIKTNTTVDGSTSQQVASNIDINTPHQSVEQHKSEKFNPISERTSVSTSTPLVYAYCSADANNWSISDILNILQKYSEVPKENEINLSKFLNLVPKIELPQHIYDKLQEALKFEAACKQNKHPKIPDSYYLSHLSTQISGTENYDDLTTLLHSNSFQLNAARLSALAYKEKDDDLASKLERSSWKWDINKNFGSHTAGGIVAEYTPGNGPTVQVTAFLGTQGDIEWGKYTLESSNQFSPANHIDPRIQNGYYANTSFINNYKASAWSPPLNHDRPHVFTGHSRGGSIAQIACLATSAHQGNFNNLGTLTFAAPAVFCSDLAKYIDENMGPKNVKIVLREDFIPHILGWNPEKVIGTTKDIKATFRSTGVVYTYPSVNTCFPHSMKGKGGYLETIEKVVNKG